MKLYRQIVQEKIDGLNEVKISQGQGLKYFNIIKKYLGSKTMDMEQEMGYVLVNFDNITLVFKDMYLVGFKEDGEYFEVSRNLKSIKELKNVRDFSRFFGKQVQSVNDIKKPKEVIEQGDSELFGEFTFKHIENDIEKLSKKYGFNNIEFKDGGIVLYINKDEQMIPNYATEEDIKRGHFYYQLVNDTYKRLNMFMKDIEGNFINGLRTDSGGQVSGRIYIDNM